RHRGRCAAFCETGRSAHASGRRSLYLVEHRQSRRDRCEAPACLADCRLLSHKSHRARERHNGRVQPHLRGRSIQNGGGIMFLTNFFQHQGLPFAWSWTISQVIIILVFQLLLALSVAAFILADRKIWAAVQMRRGPNVVGAFGLLQTIADALKFFFKEVIIPAGANKVLFVLGPLITATLAFSAWAVIPVSAGWVVSNINVGILYLFAISSLGVYGVIVSGWASNSKYAFLSALRAAAQMVSYEVSIGF